MKQTGRQEGRAMEMERMDYDLYALIKMIYATSSHSLTHPQTHTHIHTWKGKCWIARHLRCTAGTKERRGKQVSKRTERKVKYEAAEENLLPNLLVYFTPPPALSLSIPLFRGSEFGVVEKRLTCGPCIMAMVVWCGVCVRRTARTRQQRGEENDPP